MARYRRRKTAIPSGGNARNWAFVAVRDPDRLRRLGVI